MVNVPCCGSWVLHLRDCQFFKEADRIESGSVCLCARPVHDNTATRVGDESTPNSQAKEREIHDILELGEMCVLP